MSPLWIVTTLLLFLMTPGTSLGAEKKEVANKKEVSQAMAEAWCRKLEECAKDSGMDGKECRKVLKKSFLDGFKNTAEGQKVEVTKELLYQCTESIHKDSCEALKTAQTLPGCEFIAYLNRY